MKRPVALRVEELESRLVPATWGNPWPDPTHLTISFAPDGTSVGNRQSNLFQAFGNQNPSLSHAWQLAILQAFQSWAANANIDISLVNDGGQPFGTTGAIQGDPRFGDIRVAAFPFSPQNAGMEDLAIASPFDTSAGTWSGDVRVNSSYSFSPTGGPYDLYTVMVHEAGHVLGLDHNDNDPPSVMYPSYVGTRTALAASDIASIQALYGARPADQFEGATGNNQFATATALQPNVASGALTLQADADVTTLQDQDYYRFNTLADTGRITIQVQTSGISLLTPSVTVYDASHQAIASTVVADPTTGGALITLNSVRPLSTYYVAVQSGRSDVFGIGAYRLTVNYLPGIALPTAALLSAVNNTSSSLLNDDHHTNDSFLTASLVPQLSQQTDARFDYAYKASISDARDVDFYRITSPTPPAGQANVLTAMVWGLDSLANNGLAPRVLVFDGSQHAVKADILVNDNGSYTVQFANATANAPYFVEVLAANSQGANNVGNYFLGINFGTIPVNLQTFASGTLNSTLVESTAAVSLSQDLLFHFVLSADSAGVPIGTGLAMTITDANGNAVFSTVVQAGDTISRNVFLPQGQYTVHFRAQVPAGASGWQLAFRLKGLSEGDPIGPQAQDPTAAPMGGPSGSSSPDPGSGYTWSGGTNSGTSAQPPSGSPPTTS